MLRSTARGIPRFSITSEPLSSSIRRSSFPKLARARSADTTIVPALPALEVMAINSPFRLFELYSSFEMQSRDWSGGILQEGISGQLSSAQQWFWERFGKELKICVSRTESTGRVFLYVLITRRSSVQIGPPQPKFLSFQPHPRTLQPS